MEADLSHLPPDKRALLDQLVNRLSRVPGVAAIALGGSYASRTHHATSDLDLGLYYHDDRPFAIAAIREVARNFSAAGEPIVTDFYEWGAWVNGGAWIHTAQGKVDFLYRSLDHVRRTIEEAQNGIWQHDYDQQPTYGFYSPIYLAETHICLPLFDPAQILVELKRQVERYPPRLKQRVIADSLWSAEFTLLHARGFAAQGDVYNTVGCLTRAAASLTQALFALNEQYFIRDKQVMQTLAGFPILPPGYVSRLTAILAEPGSSPQALTRSVEELEQLWRSVTALPGVTYQPRFRI